MDLAAVPPVCDFGWKAHDFTLKATDGTSWSLDDVRGEKGTLLIFICNHCPYVLRALDSLVHEAHALMERGVGVAAICSNDSTNYPADSFENMAVLATTHGFRFPYLHDETQEVARAYDAACTPDYFGFNADLELQYRGRLEGHASRAGSTTPSRELYEAMVQIAETGLGPAEQTPSMGCSIKWKNN